ncbi:MAG: DDE-type integrase/transposase/recombinase [Magnetococcales bacterium]|nr:DDE-type integrase/transposase/recombinase [Magnetococcales bacterium]
MSAGLSLKPRSKVSINGRPYIILKAVDVAQVLVKDIGTGETEVAHVVNLKPLDEAKSVSSPPLEAIHEDDLAEARRRLEIIRPLLEPCRGMKNKVRQLAKEFRVGEASLYRWLKRYKAREWLSDLAPQNRKKAKHSKLDKKIEAVVQSVINDFYLTKQKQKIVRVVEEVTRRCRAAGLRPPHANSVRKRIKEIDPRLLMAKRQGGKAARDKFAEIRGSFPGADWPLAVVQIDHTKLDIEVVDDVHRMPIGRPWLTLAIDVFSRMVAGLYVSLDAPSAFSVGMCICQSALQKEPDLDRLGIKDEWPVWGMMRTLHADNGKEFHSEMLKKACDEYGINIEWRPVRVPHFGGHIERLMGTVATELHALPGTTFSNVRQKGDYNSQAKAVMTLDELSKWLVQFFVGVYHKRNHAALGMPPIEKWRRGIVGHGREKGIGMIEPISDPRRLRLDFLPFSERTVQREGIAWDKVTYFGDILRPWINAKKGNVKQKFLVRRDPRDISHIWFFDPQIKEYFEVPYRDLTHPSISIWEYKAAERHLKQQGRSAENEDDIFAARETMWRIADEAKQETRKVRRARQRVRQIEKQVETLVKPIVDPANSKSVAGAGTLTLVVDNKSPKNPDAEERFDFDTGDLKSRFEEW